MRPEGEVMSATERQFRALAEQYYRETMFRSCFQYDHPAMQEIIKMGKPALPFIFREIEGGASDWYYAIRQITGEEPQSIAKEDAGVVEVLSAKYLQWGKEKGYTGASHTSLESEGHERTP